MVSNKNDIHDPDIRARLAAQEVNMQGDVSFFAATPPRESKRMLLSQFSTEETRHGKPLKLSFIDVRKAYFYGKPSRKICIRPPPELGLPQHTGNAGFAHAAASQWIVAPRLAGDGFDCSRRAPVACGQEGRRGQRGTAATGC